MKKFLTLALIAVLGSVCPVFAEPTDNDTELENLISELNTPEEPQAPVVEEAPAQEAPVIEEAPVQESVTPEPAIQEEQSAAVDSTNE